MEVDIACAGFGPAMGGFLTTLTRAWSENPADPAFESKAAPGMPLQVLCYERADDIAAGVSGVVTRAQGLSLIHIYSHAIAAVCRFCKSVHTYFLERDSPGHAPGNAAIFADPIHETMDGPMLGCGKEGCQALVPLFAQWTPGSTKEERNCLLYTSRCV